MSKLNKCLFFILPIILLLVFQQLHLIPAYCFAIIYPILSIYYSLINPEKITNKYLREGQDMFKIGTVVAFAFILIITAFPIGGYMTVPLIVPHSTENADAVLVLASGATPTGDPTMSTYQRVIHGAKLVKSGQAKHMYISTGFSPIYGFMEYKAVSSLTQMLDIPQDKVTIFKSEEIITTATEAQYAKKFFDSIGINKILLTTSNAHIYRSCLTFRKIGFTVLPAPCHNKENTVYANPNYIMFKAAMHEWIGLIWYYIRGRI